jgi:hypothetical protein
MANYNQDNKELKDKEAPKKKEEIPIKKEIPQNKLESKKTEI